MKTAIIYRSNKNLDENLAGLKGKVELFHAFPAEAKEEQMKESAEDLINKLTEKGEDDKYMFKKIICDLTSYKILRGVMFKKEWWEIENAFNVVIIKQSLGFHKEYTEIIAKEARNLQKNVIIIKKNLADHCEIDGINKYRIESKGGDVTLFLEQIIRIWEEAMNNAGVSFITVENHHLLDKNKFNDKIVVCDHHYNNHTDDLHDLEKAGKIIMKNAYLSSGVVCISIDEIPLLEQIGGRIKG